MKGGERAYNLPWRVLTAARRAKERPGQGGGNAYNLQELAGAFGDLGTLIPFLVGYITISKMDPVGVLVGFRLFKIIAGLYCKTPIPIQPMKAIGTAAISHAGTPTNAAGSKPEALPWHSRGQTTRRWRLRRGERAGCVAPRLGLARHG